MTINSANISHYDTPSATGLVVMFSEKKTSKSNETRIFTKTYQDRWLPFPDLELEQALNSFTQISIDFITLESLVL